MKNNEINILVVEDEVIANAYLINILKSLEYENIFEASSFDEALEIVKNNKIHLAFMDININGAIDGINCARLLNKEYFLPIIFTTAYTDSETIIDASDTNSFGYLIKPFEKSEVLATLLITLKKIKIEKITADIPNSNTILSVDLGNNQMFDFSSKTLFINGEAINLTKKEREILEILCRNLNHNISSEILKVKIWEDSNISNSTIRDSISRLKKKIPDLNIETIINFGYILKI